MKIACFSLRNFETALFFCGQPQTISCGFQHNRCPFTILYRFVHAFREKLRTSSIFCKMPQGNAPLTAPSANRFAGIWSNGKEPCPITLKDLVTTHNACVKMRSAEIEIPRSGALGSVDLSGYRNKLPQFLSHWQHRLSKVIRPATRIECLDEGADKIPPLFWKR